MAQTKTFSVEDAEDIISGLHKGYQIIEHEQSERSRWAIHMRVVALEVESGNHYEFWYQSPATEMQDCDPFGGDTTVNAVQVEPVEVTVTKFIPVE